MKLMYANEYAKYSGYPTLTIKKYCRDGVIPCDRIGRKYLINPDLADKTLLERMNQNVQKSPVINADNEKVIPITYGKKSNFLDMLAKAR